MARTKVTGTRPIMLWGIIAIIVILVVGVIAGLLFIYPNYQARHDAAQATVQAQAQVEQHYQAGVAFQDAGDWDRAVDAFEKVVATDATYKDARTRLAEVKARQQEALAVAQAEATRAMATAQAQAEATAAAVTVEAEKAQATSMAATATAQARATVQAQEAMATATAEALTQLEAHYQKGLGYMNLSRWEEAKAELAQVFEVDPNYKEVQVTLSEVEAEIAKLKPTATSTPVAAPTPVTVPLPSPTPTPPGVLSFFDGRDTDGWVASDEGIVTNPGNSGSGGANDGYLLWYQGGGNTSYYIAPSKYLGDWRDYSSLRFDTWSSGGTYFTSGYKSHGDVFLANGDRFAYRFLPHRPAVSWESFAIPLTNSGEWTLGGGAISLDDVLVNVTDFQIRAEYGVGEDRSGLDSVELVR